MRKLEFAGSLLFVLLSLVVCREAYRLSLGTPGVPGPGLFPFLLGGFLFLLACIYLVKTLRAWRVEQEIPLWKGLRWKKAVFILLVLFTYALLLEELGFVLCTFLLLLSLFQWVDRQRWYWVYLGSLGITLLCYGVFKTWLKIQLPRGFLGI